MDGCYMFKTDNTYSNVTMRFNVANILCLAGHRNEPNPIYNYLHNIAKYFLLFSTLYYNPPCNWP